jgi:pentatricopeptide repeat protein
VPEPEKTKLLERGISDYEATLAAQSAYFGTLTLHAREQLLYGLTDGYAMAGQTDKARTTYERMRHDAAGSELLTRAAERAAGHTVAGDAPCEQCHAAAR